MGVFVYKIALLKLVNALSFYKATCGAMVWFPIIQRMLVISANIGKLVP